MPYYRDNLLPRIQNRIMDNKMMRERRRHVCYGLEGEVIEIGFGSGSGSGLNVPHYPATVTGVWAVDPSEGGFTQSVARNQPSADRPNAARTRETM